MKKLYQQTRSMIIAIFLLTCIPTSAQYQMLLNEDFENISTGIPDGWDISETNVSKHDENWSLFEELNGNKCVRFNCSSTSTNEFAALKSPALDLPFGEMLLSFDYKNIDGGPLAIYVSTNGGRSYEHNVLIPNLIDQPTWKTEIVSLGNFREKSDVKIIFHGTSFDGNAKAFIYLDNIKIETAPLCAEPINFSISSLSQTEISLNWELNTFGKIPTKYHIQVMDNDGNVIVDNPNLTTTGNYTVIKDLNPNTHYNVILQSDCSSLYKGKSLWSESFSFTTLCEAISIPQSFTFTGVDGILPYCWVAGGSNANSVHMSSEKASLGAGTGDKSIKLSATETDDAYVATAPLDHPANDMEVSFKIYGPKGTPILVALVSDVSDLSSAIPFITDVIPVENKWFEFVANTATTAYAAQEGLQIVFYTAPGRDRSIYIDDISVAEIPSCVRPFAVSASGVSHNNVTLNWQSQNGQRAIGYQIKFINNGIEEILTSSTNTYTHNTLNPNTNYTASVRQICAIGDTSAWSSTISFSTYCDPVSSFPFIESFEYENFPVDCWNVRQTVSGEGSGLNYGANSWDVIPEIAYDKNKSLYMKVGKVGSQALLSLPYMTIPSTDLYELRLWVYRHETDIPLSTEGIKLWVNEKRDTINASKLGFIPNNIGSAPTETKEGWYRYSFPINQSGNVFVMIEGVNQGDKPTHIDLIEVRQRPTCLPISKIHLDSTTTSSAHFSWDVETGVSSLWIVSYQTSEMDEAAIDTVSQTSYTISNLAANSAYAGSLSVSSLCSATDHSEAITLETSFRTKCLPIEFPYTEDFENNFNPNRVGCWSFPIKNAMYPDVFEGKTTEIRTRKRNMIVSPLINIDSWVGKRISFDVRGANGPIYAGLMADPTDSASFVVLDSFDISVEKLTYRLDITQEYSERHIAFMTGSSTINTSYNYFDNFKILNKPLCEDIENFKLETILESSTTININDFANTDWQVQYCPAPFSEDNDTIIDITDKLYTVQNLSPATEYVLRVRSNCGANQGNWSDFTSFKTLCTAFNVTEAVPFFEGFESGYLDQTLIEGCWVQQDLKGDNKWTANNSLSDYGRSPKTGDWNAYIGYGNNEDYMTYAVHLEANTNYNFSCFARKFTSSTYNTTNLSISLSSSPSEYENGIKIIEAEAVPKATYKEFKKYFVVPSSGIYYLVIGADMSSAKNNYLSIDDIKIEYIECAPPAESSILFNYIGTDTLSMQWTNPAPRFLMKIATDVINPENVTGSIFNDTLTGGTLTLGGLEANTTYYYYIKSVCEEGATSEWGKEGTFTTLCNPFSLPFEENFDAGAPNFACWKSFGAVAPSLNTSPKHSGSHSIKCSGTTIASPALTTSSLVGKQISMWLNASDAGAKVAIGVMSDINDINTYELIEEVTIPQKGSWMEAIVNFNILSDPDYVDFAASKNVVITVSDEHTIYVDDVKISVIPTCPKPNGLSIYNITDASAEVDWTANEETSWSVKVLSDGIAILDSIVTAHPVTITGLGVNQEYRVQVRGICATADSSEYISAAFTTACPAMVPLPFFEDFEGLANKGIISCWNNDWYSLDKSSNKWSAYIGDLTPSTSYMFNSRKPNIDQWSVLETPVLDLRSVPAATLSFDLMNAVGGEFSVLISTDSGRTFNDTLLYNLRNITTMTPQSADLTAYCGNLVVIGFKGVSNGVNGDAWIRIDNISVKAATACLKPQGLEVTAISGDSISIQILDTVGTEWELAIVEDGENLTDITDFISTISSSYTFKNLNAATRYEVHARRICDDGESAWVPSGSVTTSCAPMNIPYSEDFASVTGMNGLMCYEMEGALLEGAKIPLAEITNDSYFAINKPSLFLRTGVKYPLFVILPEMNADLDTLTMRFDYMNNDKTHKESVLEVGLIPLTVNTDDFISLETLPISGSSKTVTINFAQYGYSGRDYRIAFRSIAKNYGKTLAIDDIKIDYRETCIAPKGVDITNITATSADIAILDYTNTVWDVAYAPVGTSFDEYIVMDSVTDKSISISGLNISTRYDVQVRAACNGGFTGWSSNTYFNTACGAYTITAEKPYAENFNSYGRVEIPSCWTVYQSYENDEAFYPSVLSGTIEMRDAPNTILAPRFTNPLNKLYLNMSVRTANRSGKGTIYIGYTTDANNPNGIVDVYAIEATAIYENILVDLTTFPAEAQYIVFRTLNEDDIMIDNVNISLAPKCYTPSTQAASVSYITNTSMIFSFTPSEQHSAMEYAIYENGTEQRRAWTTDLSVHVTGLAEQTKYALVYRSTCNDNGAKDTAAWSDTIFFSTHTAPATMPYVCGFEDTSDNAAWTIVGDGANKWIISGKEASAVRQGSNAMYISNGDSSNNYTGTAQASAWTYRTIELTRGIYDFSYLYKLNGNSNDYMRALLTPADHKIEFSTMESEEAIPVDNGGKLYEAPTWTMMNKTIVIEERGYYNLSFFWVNDNKTANQTPAAIDSISITKQSCASLVNARISDVSSTSATVLMNDLNESTKEYQVYLTTDINALPVGSAAQTFTSDTAVVTPLIPGTQYYIFARAVCAAADSSTWSRQMKFVSKCVADTITIGNPFFDGFEDYVDNRNIVGCWSQVTYAGTAKWKANMSQTSSNRGPRSGNGSATLQRSNIDKLMRNVYLQANHQYNVKIYARQDGINPNDASLMLSLTDDSNNEHVIVEQNIMNGKYQDINGTFIPETDGTFTLSIIGTIKNGPTYLTIDDLTIEEIACATPTDLVIENITANAATITWTSYADSTEINIKGGIYPIDTTVICTAGNNSITINELSTATNYTVEIKNICGAYKSTPVSTIFATSCAVVELPYFNDFENYYVNDVPACWDNTQGTVSPLYAWKIADKNGNKVMQFNSSVNKNGNFNILKTIPFNVTNDAEAEYTLSFDYMNPNGGALSAYLSKDGGATYTDTVLDEVRNITDWTKVIHTIEGYEGEQLTVVFHSVSNQSIGDAYHYLDNFKIAKFGGNVYYNAEVCAGMPFSAYGFNLSSNETMIAGPMTLQRMEYAANTESADTNYVLNLHINPAYNNVIYDEICKGGIYNVGLFSGLTELGTYIHSSKSKDGCDSLVILHLDVINLDTTLVKTICEGDSVEFFGAQYSSTGTFTSTTTIGECLSIRTLQLTVLPREYHIEEHICEGDTLYFENIAYVETGVYSHSHVNALGCDSIIHLHLTVHGIGSTVDTTICEGQSIYFNGEYRASSGTYSQMYNNEWGCDSTATLNLIVTPADTTVVNDFVCEDHEYYNYGIAGLSISADTIIFTRGKNGEGCDSVVELHLALSPSAVVYDTVVIRENEEYEFGGNSLSVAGDYDHTFANAMGCDSIVYLRLDMYVSTNNTSVNKLSIAPNPVATNSTTYVHKDWTYEQLHGMRMDIIDAMGKVISSHEISQYPIIVNSPATPGIYTIRITTGNGEVHIGKLINH